MLTVNVGVSYEAVVYPVFEILAFCSGFGPADHFIYEGCSAATKGVEILGPHCAIC